MTSEQLPAEGDGLHAVAADLVSAFENLGAEHQALLAEERETTHAERRATMRRMTLSIREASSTLAHATHLVTQAYGMRGLGITGQRAKGAESREHMGLPSLGDPDELLRETASHVQAAAQHLAATYKPTKKNPDLATARHPTQLNTVLSSLRAALTGLGTELAARDRGDGTAEFDASIALLSELESRLCRVVPAQASGPTADEVTAAILSSPEIARAAAAALERASA